LISAFAILTPENVKPSPPNHWFLRRFRIRIRDNDEMLNWNLSERDDLRLPGEFIAKIEDQNDRNIDVGGDESFGFPAIAKVRM